MAYAQQPRHGAPQRLPYQDHQPSRGHFREPHAGKDGYGPRLQAWRSNDSPRGGHSEAYQNNNGQTGRMYNEEWLDQDKDIVSEDRQYRGGGPSRRGRWPPAQRPQGESTEIGQYAYNDTRSRGAPRSRPAQLTRGYYHQQEPYYRSNQYREPQSYEQHYQPERVFRNSSHDLDNGAYGYDEFSLEAQDNWTSTQHYTHTSYSDDRGPEVNPEYSQHDRGDPYDRAVSPSNYKNNQPPRQPEATGSRFNQNQLTSTRPPDPQRPEPPIHRIIQTPVSPDSVAWDNPFPTFPMRPSKARHVNATGLDASLGSTDSSDGSWLGKTYDKRPQNTRSKSSNALSPSGGEKPTRSGLQHETNTSPSATSEANFNSKRGGYFDGQQQPENDTWQYRGPLQGRPGASVDQLRPIVDGRHSEDNRTRPSFPLYASMETEYERSRTMPEAISEVALLPGRPRDQSAWQEPGFVAGYHGPEDRGYTPTSPLNESIHGSLPQTKRSFEQSDAVVHARSTDSRPPHVQKDSLGDFFDNYYNATHDDHRAFLQRKDRYRRSPADEEMPNFDGVSASSAGRRRGMTIDEHLQPRSGTQEYPPLPAHPREDVRRDHRNDSSSNTRQPRSRSQPNYKGRRSPRPPLDEKFDFGVPGAPNRPPVIANGRDGYGLSSNGPIGSPDTRPDLVQRNRQHQGPTQSKGNHPSNPHRVNSPASGLGQFPTVYYGNGPPDRHRSPPAQNGRSLQTGQSGGRPSPINDRPRPTLPSATSPPNPDALPSHPAPVRPGLRQGSPVNQVPKPVPIRHYNSIPSPMQSSSPAENPGLLRAIETQKDSILVTHQELERLQQATMRKPDDQKNQFLLARKLVEAASILVDEQADPRTRNKNREKYILDAHKIVKKLSSNGYSEATFYLADAYSRGSLGLEPDTREAFKLYQSAAKAGHAEAAYRVAVCCEIGHEEGGGTSQDAVKAMQWYKRAATLGDTPAMYKMGIISLKGLLGQQKNPREAVVWLKRAAERADRENPHALHELALLHEKPNSDEGVTRDEAYSKQLFAQAAELGYKFSQFRLGCAYEYGLMGCPVDPRQSITWYSKAAVQEEHQSELALSGWYLTGSEGVLQQSDTEAYLWARKGAQSGLAKAEYAMGYFTEVGIGAPANLEDAKRWYWKSASQGFEKARGRLEELKRGNPAKQKTRVSRSTIRKNSEGDCTIM